MMGVYSNKSNAKLAQVTAPLATLFRAVVEVYDNTIITGHRGQLEQDEAVRLKKSKTPWPTSKHNSYPSKAVDAAPYVNGGIPWPELPEFYENLNATERHQFRRYVKRVGMFNYFAGHVMMAAHAFGIKLRWGGDWDRDTDTADQTFDDLVHFEEVD